jgi:ATP diphosphatase
MNEEIAELQDEIAPEKQAAEYGDLLFAMANLGRHLGIDPECALRAANEKFQRRFRHIEDELAKRGSAPEKSTLAEMDALWDDAKMLEKG